MPSKSKKKKGTEQKKRKKVSYIYRKRGKKAISDGLLNVLKPSEEDVMKLLAAQVHIGRRKTHVNMNRYIWKRRRDGINIINLEKTWAKIMLAARILVTINDPSDICVMSTRTYGQRGAIKFAQYTGATPIVGKWVPGTFTNPRNKRAFKEPRILIVDDPKTCFPALRETCYVGVPTIAFSGIDCNLRFVDCAIPINNRGKYSIGLIFYLLAREFLRMKGEIPRNEEWKESVDLFFYRTQDEVIKMQEKEKAKNNNDNIADDDDGLILEQNVGDDGTNNYNNDGTQLNQQQLNQNNQQLNQNNQQQLNQSGNINNDDEQDQGWEAEPPQYDDDDDGWGGGDQGNMDFDTW